MLFGAITFAARQWFWPVAILFVIGIICILWQSIRGPATPTVRFYSVVLRLLGLALLCLCLLEPMRSDTRAKPGANYFAVIADNSMGLMIKDANAVQTRGQQLKEHLEIDKQPWLAQLGRNFQVRKYLFDSRLQTSKDFTDLNFEGRASAIGNALASLKSRFQSQPLAGALLFTDGNATDLPNGIAEVQTSVPIFPVVIGNGANLKDISITKVSASQTAFEDAPVTIIAEVNATGFDNQSIIAQLITENSSTNAPGQTNVPPANVKIVAEDSQIAANGTNQIIFRFQTRPEKSGLNFYKIRVALKGAELPNSTGQLSNFEEATLYNNTRALVVDRGRGPYRILYVGGRPNWEYKFLNRALAEDDQLQLVGLIRIARREPKFSFRGRGGESSNPLYRGFDKVDEETQRYDQPVLIRLNTKDDLELRAGYPKSAEDLYPYHAIIFDDVESDFFTPDQMLLTQKFVSERGGGFLMLGGVDSMGAGKYVRTPVGEMLPIYLDSPQSSTTSEGLHLDFTREGLLQPWARLRANESDERSRLENLRDFQILNNVRGIKPGASAILTARDKTGQSHPALVVQRFGQGRTAALALGDAWRSGLGDEDLQKDLAKFWRQLARWLTADVPEKVEIAVQPKPADPDQSVVFTVRARNKKFQPLDNASIKLRVMAPSADGGTNSVTLAAEQANNDPGVYEATFIPRISGAYKVAATVIDDQGITVGEAETGWTSDPLAEEFKNLAPNRGLLEAIAKKSGGEVIEISALDKFIESLPSRKAPLVETHSYPLWHQPFVFLLALCCFVVEWGMRRWKGLA